jgi:hypothetical protein
MKDCGIHVIAFFLLLEGRAGGEIMKVEIWKKKLLVSFWFLLHLHSVVLIDCHL